MIKQSVVISSLVPQTSSSLAVLEKALKVLSSTRVNAIELYVPFANAKDAGKVMDDYGILEKVYPIAGVQKKEGFSLCDPVKEKRLETVDLMFRAFDAARNMGARKVLITSGRDYSDRDKAWDLLMDSMERILPEGRDLDIVLETGDRNVDACQFLGPTDYSVKFTEEVRRNHNNFFLTLDTSHIAQLGENAAKAVMDGFDVSNHFHMATCFLTSGHPLYGDKHPFFKDEGVVLRDEELSAIFSSIKERAEKENKDILIGHEVIDRSGEELGGLSRAIKESPWYFG